MVPSLVVVVVGRRHVDAVVVMLRGEPFRTTPRQQHGSANGVESTGRVGDEWSGGVIAGIAVAVVVAVAAVAVVANQKRRAAADVLS